MSIMVITNARATIRYSSWHRVRAATAGAIAFVVAGTVSGYAQQASREATAKSSKPGAAKHRLAPPPKSMAVGLQQKPWSIEDALPDRQDKSASARRSDVPAVSTPQLGRIPLEQGSFGLATDTKFKSNEFGDGRRVPGQETIKRHEPTYFGLSLSVPTDNKSLFPALFLGRPE
jgi:hypothetical protein